MSPFHGGHATGSHVASTSGGLICVGHFRCGLAYLMFVCIYGWGLSPGFFANPLNEAGILV